MISLYFIVYAIMHSALADQRLKTIIIERLSDRIYHGWYRLFYNLFAIMTIVPLLLMLGWQPSPIMYQIPERLQPLFTLLQIVGLVGLVVSLLQIDSLRFMGVKQAYAYLNNAALPLAGEPLTKRGLYGVVRHPLYLFSLITLWFVPVMTQAMVVFNVLVTLYFLIGSRIEEQRMVRYYGTEYTQYQSEVPWLIPFSKMSQ